MDAEDGVETRGAPQHDDCASRCPQGAVGDLPPTIAKV